MHHLDEHTLEMFVLLPDRFAPEQTAEIRAHVQTCPGCRSVESGLRQFHEALSAGTRPDPDLLRRMMEEVLPLPRVIRLSPYHARPDVRMAPGGHTTVLAAMTPKQHLPALDETVATLASEPDKTLVRIRREGQEHAYRMYVLSDDPRKRDSVLVSLPALGDFVTDRNGQVAFEIRAEHEPSDWAQVEGLLKLPVAVFSFRSVDLPLHHQIRRQKPAGEDQCDVEFSLSDGHLHIAVRGTGVPSTALVQGSAGTTLTTLFQGSGDILLKGGEGPVMVRLYL